MSPLEAKELFLPVEVAGSDVEACGDGLDLAVKVVESASKQQKEAYDYAGSILNHPQLSHEEKHSLLWVLAQSPAFHSLVPSSIIDDEVHDLPEWIHCSSSSVLGLDVSRQEPVAPERVHKMRGITTVPASAEVTFDLVTEFKEMQKWDAMLQSLDVLDEQVKAYPVTHVGTFLSTYGVPAGMSWLFNDRQFLCRGVGVAFPDGTRALAVYSPPDGTYPGDPGVTKSRTIRAHMGVSGYVVSPYAGEERSYLGQDRCQITMVLQVDPRGGVPLPVYNTVHMMMPMNLQRIKMAAGRLKPAEVQHIHKRQEALVAASKAAAAAAEGLKGADAATAAEQAVKHLRGLSLNAMANQHTVQQQQQAVRA